MARYFDRLIGNDTLRHRLGAEFSGNSFSHAYIIEGPRGSGKHTLAREIAKAIACLQRETAHTVPCDNCKFCRKIENGLCPDVITISRGEDRATMGVEAIRTLRESIATVPNELDVKVYVIEDAHTMTMQAQNALLLTLEEPPPFVLFLLLTEDAGALLETVRSRAPILRMQPIKAEALRRYLQDAPDAKESAAALLATAPEEFEEMLLLADGKIGMALTLLDKKKREPMLEHRRIVREVVLSLADTAAIDRLLFAIRALGQGREELKVRLSMLNVALRDLIAVFATDKAPLLFFTDQAEATALSDRLSVKKLLAYLGVIDEAHDALLTNANANLTTTHLLSRLLSIAKEC